jgi:hypothetical protein
MEIVKMFFLIFKNVSPVIYNINTLTIQFSLYAIYIKTYKPL